MNECGATLKLECCREPANGDVVMWAEVKVCHLEAGHRGRHKAASGTAWARSRDDTCEPEPVTFDPWGSGMGSLGQEVKDMAEQGPTDGEIVAALKAAGSIRGAAEQLGCSRGLLERRGRESAPVRRALKKANKGRGKPRLAEGEETKQVLVKAPESLVAKLDRASKRLGISRAEATRQAWELWLEGQ